MNTIVFDKTTSKTRLHRAFWYGAGLLLTLAACAPLLHAQHQHRVAVLSFDVSTDARQQAQSNNVHGDLGAIMADLMIDQLVKGGRVTVVERNKLDQILKEQNFENSDRADLHSAAKIGKLLGVDDVVIGTVTGFSIEKQTKSFGNGLGLGGALRGTRFNEAKVTATAAVTAQLVDVNTAAILASASGTGQSERKSSGVAVTGYDGGGYSTGDSSFASSLVGEATTKAILQASMELQTAPALVAPVAAPPRTPYEGEVADVNGNTLILTVGSNDGVRVGDTVEIERPGRVIRNPDTNAVLKVLSDHLGEGRITEVDASSSTVSYAGSPVKVKDHARFMP